jgi:hypothetical protein
MNFWNRRNKIEFFHNEPSIIDNFPVIESKNLKLQWVKKAREDFENLVKSGTDTEVGFSHIARCPGIFDLFKYGYIISLHRDVIIYSMDNNFNWRTAPGALDPILENFTIGNPTESSVNLISKPPWARNFMVKIDTGWHVVAPKGVKFLMLPIAYPDTFDFTATIGILNPALATDINFQYFWNGTDKETLIKSGTPLGHLIPLSEKKYQMVQRIMNQRDRDWIKKNASMLNSTFWTHTVRKKMTDMYNKHWKR